MIVDREGREISVEELARLVAVEVFGTADLSLRKATPFGGAAGASWRLDYAGDGGERSLFVKLPAEHGARHALFASRLREEFRISREVKTAFPETAALRTVAPAAFVESVQAYASWSAPGDSLEAVLRGAARRLGGTLAPAEALCRLAGEWLNRFHRLPSPYAATDARALLDTYYDDRLVTLAGMPDSGIRDEEARELKQDLMEMTGRALAQEPTVRCHNDYSPHNLLVDGTALCVLDYSFAGPGLRAFDVACFWHKLEDMRESLIVDARRVDALQAAFVEALDPPCDLTGDAFRLGSARLVLSKMVTLLRLPATRAARRRIAGWHRWLRSGLDPAHWPR